MKEEVGSLLTKERQTGREANEKRCKHKAAGEKSEKEEREQFGSGSLAVITRVCTVQLKILQLHIFHGFSSSLSELMVP